MKLIHLHLALTVMPLASVAHSWVEELSLASDTGFAYVGYPRGNGEWERSLS